MVSKKFSIAKQLGGKRVITNKGEEIGRLSDIVFDERSGRMETLLIEPNTDSKIARNMATTDGMATVPFKAVFAVSDVIVVDESLLV